MTDRLQEARSPADPALSEIVRRLRLLCAEKGWDQKELARRAGVSRTTLYHLLHGQTVRPRSSTLGRLAVALGTTVAALERPREHLPQPGDKAPPPEPAGSRNRQHIFAGSANHCVIDVCEENPELFQGWSEQQWGELYSEAGTGARLTTARVRQVASRINAHRQTLHRLRTVLKSHLEPVATGMIDTLYRMLNDPRAAGPPRTAKPDRAGE